MDSDTKKYGVVNVKKLLKSVVCTMLTVWLLLGDSLTVQAEEPSISAYAYALYCVNTGEFMLVKNGDIRLPMASTTKIMTAVLGLEKLQADENETTVTVTEEMYAEGSSMYLRAGETLLMSDLVGGMLMVSGNDAANAIALTVGGSFEGFANLMNEKAQEIGLTNSGFVTPSGLDAEGHYTTACDLAKLMEYCMENSMFREIDSGRSITVNFVEPSDKTQTYYNENKLLSKYEYCVAGKTGYTEKAGRTLVSCAEKDGIRLIAATLNDGDDWNDHIKMYEYGFEHLTMEKPGLEFGSLTIPVVGGTQESIKLEVGEQPLICVDGDEGEEPQAIYKLPKFVYAPISKGSKVGYIEYYKNGVYSGQSEVTTSETVPYRQIPTTFLDNILSFFLIRDPSLFPSDRTNPDISFR